MSNFQGVRCIRCGREMPGAFYSPCPYCAKEQVNCNYTTYYDFSQSKLPPSDNGQNGIFRFRDFLPLRDRPVHTLQEGNTPLLSLKRLGARLGLERLYLKDETRNPTWSWKDRLCAVLVNKAKQDGAPGVVISSAGNHGASVAAYATAMDMPCLIFINASAPRTMRTFMLSYNAKLFLVNSMEDRWKIMKILVDSLGYAPMGNMAGPPIGTSPFGIDGYKTISYEIFEQMDNQAPDWVVVPTGFGDGIYGIYKGMCDLREMGYLNRIPRFAAAEVWGALEATLAQNDSDIPLSMPSGISKAVSIATGYSTYQAYAAVKDSQGVARSSHDEDAQKMQLLLAETEGIYAELGSVASLVIIDKLIKEEVINTEDKVVALVTSTGLKAPSFTEELLPKIPFINPTMDELRLNMKKTYGTEL